MTVKQIFTSVLTKYLEVDCSGNFPDSEVYNWKDTYFLQLLVKLNDEEIANHGTVRLFVDKKMGIFGHKLLYAKLLLYLVFLIALAYSLIQSSYVRVPLEAYTQDVFNLARIASEAFVVLYFIYNVITETMEFIRIFVLAKNYIVNKKNNEKKERSFCSRIYNFTWIRASGEYFGDLSNYLDFLGLLSLLILVILRVFSQPSQWIFATLAFLINGFRIFKYVALVPKLGPYTIILFKILISDVPLFSIVFFLIDIIFAGGYFIALRTPYSTSVFRNASVIQDTSRVVGLDNSVEWVFLSGMRILLEGNIYADEYLYKQLNWLAAIIYFAFLFLVIVVLLNVFIAQLSDTYGDVRMKVERIFALHELKFIIQIEKTSLISFFISFRKHIYKYFKLKTVTIRKPEMLEYYGEINIKRVQEKRTQKMEMCRSMESDI